MHRGFAKLYRKFLEWEWYDDIPCKVLYVHCLLKANHKSKKYRGVEVARGTFLSGRETLAKETGLSVQQIRTAMSKIQPEYITSISTSAGTIISVVDFDTYNGETVASNQHSNTQPTSEQPESNQRATTTKNEKKDKNENNEKKYPAEFERFWDFVKNKKGKKASAREWSKLGSNRPETDFLIETLKAQYEYKDYMDSIGKFCPEIPHIERWLKNRRFEDEIPKIEQPKDFFDWD